MAHWRLTTARDQTVDEYGILTRELFTLAGIDPHASSGVIISSVVPPLNSTLEEMSERYFHVQSAVHRAWRQNRHARAVRQSAGSGRGPDREQRGGIRKVRRPVHRRWISARPLISTSSPSAENIMGGVLAPASEFRPRRSSSRRPAVPRGNQGSRKNYRHQHRRVPASRPLLRLRGHGGRHRRSHQKSSRRKSTSNRHRRPAPLIGGSRHIEVIDEFLTLEGLRIVWERNSEPSRAARKHGSAAGPAVVPRKQSRK